MKVKRIISAGLITALVCTMLSGCQGKEEKAQNSNKMTLQIISGTSTTDYTETEVFKQLEEKYDVQFEFVDVGSNYMDTYQTMIASGDTPDYFLWIPKTNFEELQKQGAFAEIPEGMVEEKSPELYKFYQKYVDKEDPFKYSSVDGKNYGLPVPWSIGKTCNVTGIREDWMEAVGIEKTPETLEELYTTLKAFREDDPDKNGEKDTYGWASMLDSTGAPTMFTPVFGAYGVYPGIFYEKDGEIIRGEVQPEAKEALETLNKWYEEGLLDPEFMVDTTDTLKEKWIAEKYGYVTEKWYEMIPEKAFNSGFYHDKLIEKNPDAELTILEAPKGSNGESGLVQVNPMRGDMVNFSAKMTDQPEKMAKYIEVFGDASFNEAVLELCWKGKEEVTFTKSDDGGYQWTKEYEDPAKRNEYGIGFTSLSSNFQDYDLLAKYMTEPQYMEIRQSASEIGTGEYDVLAAVSLHSWAANADALNRFSTQNYVDFITGAKSLDEFDAFVEEWYQMGGTEVLTEAQEVYDNL